MMKQSSFCIAAFAAAVAFVPLSAPAQTMDLPASPAIAPPPTTFSFQSAPATQDPGPLDFVSTVVEELGVNKGSLPGKTVDRPDQPMPPAVPAGLSPIERMFAGAGYPEYGTLGQFGYHLFRGAGSPPLNAVGDDYVLGPGDRLVLYLWGDPVDMKEVLPSYDLTVDRTGTVFLAPLGQLAVWGQDLGSLRASLKSQLDRKYKRLGTSVILAGLREFPIPVTGFAQSPGTVMATGVDTVVSVLSRAGGVARTGSLRTVTLIRPGRKGAPETTVIDFYDFLVKGKPVDLRIREGDTVFVPGISQVAGVAGEVRRPGIYELSGEKSLADLVSLAGGTLPSARSTSTSLVSFAGERRELKTGDLSGASFAAVAPKDGDLLLVGKVSDGVENSVVVSGAVFFPGKYEAAGFTTLKALLERVRTRPDTNMYYGRVYRVNSAGRDLSFTFSPRRALDGVDSRRLAPMDTVVLYRYDERPGKMDFDRFPETVLVEGPVRYPGPYAWTQDSSLSTFVAADSVLLDTDMGYALVVRPSRGGRTEYITFSPSAVVAGKQDLRILAGDTIRFHSASDAAGRTSGNHDFDAIPDIVMLEGAIRTPGARAWRRGLTLLELIGRPDLPQDADTGYAEIQRRIGASSSLLQFSPSNVLAGVERFVLEAGDIIRFFPKFRQRPVRVTGEVAEARIVPFHAGMTILDILGLAGLKGPPDRLKVVVGNGESVRATIYLADLLKRTGMEAMRLEPGDSVVVRSMAEDERRPAVVVRGAVASPRTLPWRPGMLLSEAIAAAGGVEPRAFIKGIVLIRRSAAIAQERQVDRLIARLDSVTSLAVGTGSLSASGAAGGNALEYQMEIAAQKARLAELSSTGREGFGRVYLELPESVEALAGSAAEVPLEEGDSVFVPEVPTYVLVAGEVTNQSVLAYRKGMTVRDAVEASGGILEESSRNRIHILTASGTTITASGPSFLFFTPDILSRRLSPGDTVVVPRTEPKVGTAWMYIKDIVQMTTQLVTATVSTIVLLGK